MDFHNHSFPGVPLIKTIPPGPKSKEYLDYQFSHEGSAVSYPRGMPMALRRAKGATVEDEDGNLYIDFFGGAGVMNVGHSNPEVIEAAKRQLIELTHSLDFPNCARKALVETLLTLLPEPLDRVFFGGPTGSDAVEAAMKLAKHNTRRFPMIAFAAGNAAINFMIKNNLAEHALVLGNLILSWLKEIEKDSKVVGEARGKGLMLGVELVKDKATKEPAPELARKVRTFCHRHGLLIEIGGHYSNVARFLPPLILTEELAKKGTEIFADAVRDAEKLL